MAGPPTPDFPDFVRNEFSNLKSEEIDPTGDIREVSVYEYYGNTLQHQACDWEEQEEDDGGASEEGGEDCPGYEYSCQARVEREWALVWVEGKEKTFRYEGPAEVPGRHYLLTCAEWGGAMTLHVVPGSKGLELYGFWREPTLSPEERHEGLKEGEYGSSWGYFHLYLDA